MELYKANATKARRGIREAHGANLGSHYQRSTFSNLTHLMILDLLQSRETDSSARGAASSKLFDSWNQYGPLLTRIMAQEKIKPMATITLQRNTVDVGSGNAGLLSLGELPAAVKNESLTWVPVRLYSSGQGGLQAPLDSPEERYPIAWEVVIDEVYFDGEKLPRSTLTPPSISISALIDTVCCCLQIGTH